VPSSNVIGRVCGAVVLAAALLLSLLLCRPDPAREGGSRITTLTTAEHTSRRRGAKVASNEAHIAPPSPKPSLSSGSQIWQQRIFFERNDGQVNSQVVYLSRGPQYTLFLTRNEASLTFSDLQNKRSKNTRPQRYFRLRFMGSNPQALVTGTDVLPGTSNYFSGSDPKRWHTHIPQFAKVRYSNLYPGVDLVFYFRDGHLEYDLAASPGADLSAVHFQIEGAKTSLTRDGDLAIKIGAEEVVRLRKPSAYQNGTGLAPVKAHYALQHGQLSFALGHYDRARPLVIDPALIFATFITSNCSTCSDQINDIAADNTGVYLTGQTTASNFPATANITPTATQDTQTYVVKLDPTGSHIVYSTFLSNSTGDAITVDGVGSAYVSGTAYFGSPAFPLTTGVFSGTVPANAEGSLWAAYATKLSADGSTIVYSTLLQQPTSDGTFNPNPQAVSPSKIAVDSTGSLYVGGVARFQPTGNQTPPSVWMPLPVTIGAFQTTPGMTFVLKLNPNASGLDYATYFDGTGATVGTVAGITVDSDGDAFVAGATAGNTFPTTSGAYQTSGSTTNATYLMKLNSTGTAPVYSTLFGEGTEAFGLGLDPDGQAVVAGFSDGDLPITTGAFCGNAPGTSPPPEQGYVVKFTSDGSGLVYATSLCTNGSSASAVAVDSSGAAYVAGSTQSAAEFQPYLLAPIQGYIPNTFANVLVKLDTSGTLQWSTFLGRDLSDLWPINSKLAIDATGNVYVLADSDIPLTANSIGPPSLNPGVSQNTDFYDLLKIAPSLGAPVPLATPNQVSFNSEDVGTASSPMDVQVGNFGDAAMSLTVSITGDFSETDDCAGNIPGGQKCDINVVFTPTAVGNRTGTLTLTFGGNAPSQTVGLSGQGVAPAVSVSPTALSFGVQATGTTSSQQQVAVTNTGTGSLLISSVQTTSQFAATNTCGAAIAPGSGCTIQVTFTPSASGSQTGTLTIADNASNSPQTVSLEGNQPANFSLTAPGGSAAKSATVTAGQTAKYNLSVVGTNGFSGAVNFTCSGAPSNSTCSVSPNPANITGTSAVALTVSVATQAASSTSIRPRYWPTSPGYSLVGIVATFALLLCMPLARGRRSLGYAAGALAIAVLAVVFVGCGGSGSSSTAPPTEPGTSGTAAGQYTLAVSGTSGSISQSMNLSLTVK
jgi:Abnormal spindle-like microcephaly-assoc'd, ASPM-SPD-2-Hydin